MDSLEHVPRPIRRWQYCFRLSPLLIAGVGLFLSGALLAAPDAAGVKNDDDEETEVQQAARRIVEAAAGVSAETAMDLLEASGRSVRTAIVMGKLGIGREEAEKRLAGYGGRVAAALEHNG